MAIICTLINEAFVSIIVSARLILRFIFVYRDGNGADYYRR